jgi:trimeric autotransporter adhesin
MNQQLRLIVSGSLALMLLYTTNETARAGLQMGLDAYYHLDGNGLDASGNGLNLSLVGGVGFGSGLFGQAISLNDNGTQFAARPGSDATFDFGSGDFSIQIWVNFNTVNAREQTLIEKFSGESGPGWTISKVTRSGNNEMEFYSSPFGPIDSTPLSISTGAWHQVIVTRSGSSFSLYFDDNLVGSTVFSGSLDASSNPLLVGRRDSADPRDFAVDGRLDEIAFWNRALSTSEIASLWNDGHGMLIPTASVPEPSSLVVAGAGGLIYLGYCRKRRRQ